MNKIQPAKPVNTLSGLDYVSESSKKHVNHVILSIKERPGSSCSRAFLMYASGRDYIADRTCFTFSAASFS